MYLTQLLSIGSLIFTHVASTLLRTHSHERIYIYIMYIHVHDILCSAAWLAGEIPTCPHSLCASPTRMCMPGCIIYARTHSLHFNGCYIHKNPPSIIFTLRQSFFTPPFCLSPASTLVHIHVCWTKKLPWESTAEKSVFIQPELACEKGCGKTLFATYETLTQLHHTAISVIAIYAFVYRI